MNQRIIKPKKLKLGDTLGIIAPASPLNESSFELAISKVKDLGFKPKYSESARQFTGFLAGDDQTRLNDLHEMFEDDEVDGVISLRGGYGSARLLNSIDYQLIKKHPKVFIGYSDITALLSAFYVKTGLVGFHAPMAGSSFNPLTINSLVSTITGETIPKITPGDSFQVLNETTKTTVFEGAVIGGNLSILSSLLGTPYDYDYQDKIVVIEEVGEAPYRIDRMLTQLINSGKLSQVKAVVFGEFNNCDAKSNGDPSLHEVLKERMYRAKVNAVYGLEFGHIVNNSTLPIGINAQIDFKTGELQYLESPLS